MGFLFTGHFSGFSRMLVSHLISDRALYLWISRECVHVCMCTVELKVRGQQRSKGLTQEKMEGTLFQNDFHK